MAAPRNFPSANMREEVGALRESLVLSRPELCCAALCCAVLQLCAASGCNTTQLCSCSLYMCSSLQVLRVITGPNCSYVMASIEVLAPRIVEAPKVEDRHKAQSTARQQQRSALASARSRPAGGGSHGHASFALGPQRQHHATMQHPVSGAG
jgi:hypothetical protein